MIDLNNIQKELKGLTRDELILLNREIVKRIRLMDDAQRLMANTAFNKGDRVSWKDNEGMLHTGNVYRINKKTISVIDPEEPGIIWRMPAQLLNKID